MSTTRDFGYDYVFELVRQLSPEEQEMLFREMELRRAALQSCRSVSVSD